MKDDFGRAAADILFYVQKAAVACLKPSAKLTRTLHKLAAKSAAQMVKAASGDIEADEAAEAILAPLVERVGTTCAETERARRRVARAWKRMRGLAHTSSNAKGQWRQLAEAREYSTALKRAANAGWLLSALLSLGLLARRKPEKPMLHLNLLIQNFVQEARSEMQVLAGKRQPDEAGWLRRHARALKALPPALLLLSLPALARRFLRAEPPAHGPAPWPDPKQALWKYDEARQESG